MVGPVRRMMLPALLVALVLLSSGVPGTLGSEHAVVSTTEEEGAAYSFSPVEHGVFIIYNFTVEPPHGHGAKHPGPANTAFPLGDSGYLLLPEGNCYCDGWYEDHGAPWQTSFAHGMQWIAFAISIVFLCWYAWQLWKSTCGWEEVYVCAVELVKVCLEIWHEFDSPCTLYLSTGNFVLWLRYGEWLLTCPVILIHLSNLTGLADDYSKRTMRLLVSDIGTIVWGVTCALCVGWPKYLFFCMGLLYSSNTYFHAAKVFIESYHQMPKGICRVFVRLMAWCFFVSWAMFPILFLFGPEAYGVLSPYGSTIATTFADLMSKNIFGMLGHWLRVKIHEHILLHGDIRKTVMMRVAGEDKEIETFVEEEDEDTVKHSTRALASRESFIIMRDNMKAKGLDVRASLDMGSDCDAAMEKGAIASIEQGRVILAVPDISMVDFFREQFAALPAHIELVPALGGDNALQLVQQALQLGGLDFVLMHPEFLRDRQNGLAMRLRMMGQRVCAFGWTPSGPARELIEGAGIDGWLEGPSFGAGVSLPQLAQLVGRMQTLRKQTQFSGMTGRPSASFGGAGLLSASPSLSQASNAALLPGGGRQTAPGSPSNGMVNNNNNHMMNNGGGNMMNNGGGNIMMGNLNSNNAGSMQRQQGNPLYGTAPSPLNSQLGSQMGGAGAYGSQAAPATAAAAGGATEAEMLQQLMAEINRLKTELGENA